MQKTNFKTRLLALLTAVFMVIVSMPFAAFAAGEGGTDVIPNEINVSFNCWDATVVSEGADSSGDHFATYKLNSTSEYKNLPTLKDVPEDKEFKGWFIDGTDVEVVATSFSFDSLKAYAQNDSHAVSISAKLVDKEAEEINVSFNCWDATVVSEGADQSGDHYATYKLKATSEFKSLPTLKDVPENKEFKGWFIDGTDVEVVDTTFNFDSLKAYAQNASHAVSISAKLVDKEPETKTVKFCFQLNTAEGNFTDKNIAGFTSTNVSYVVGGKDTVVNVPAVEPNKGYTFKGWTDDNGDFVMTGATYDMFGKNFDAYEDGQTIWMTAVFEKDGESVQPETPELKTINVSFVDAKTGRSVADTISFVKGEDGKHFPMEATNVGKDQILQGWNGHAIDAFYGAGQWVTFDDLAKYVAASSINKDGYASLTFEADVATKQPSKPVAADVTKIYVHFNDEIGLYKTDIVYKDHGYITAPATDMSVSEYDYTWNNEDGLIFNVGDVIKFADVIDKAGAYYVEADGVVSAHISFTKTAKPQPSEDVLTKNIKFQISQVEGAKWTEKEYNDEDIDTRIYTVYSDVTGKYTAPAAAMDGKDFLYWVCQYGDKVIKINAGEQFNYADMTAKGISATETGDFAFNPVFKDKASSSSSSASSSSNKTTTASSKAEQKVVKAAAAPANTTKVLPKTGASNVAPLLGGSLAVVALLMGYGVYSLVLRKKD